MTKQNTPNNVFTQLQPQVDELGLLLADIADLNRKADEIKSMLKIKGYGVYEGEIFRAVVVKQERTTYDNDVLKTVVAPEILEFAKREASVSAVRVTARK